MLQMECYQESLTMLTQLLKAEPEDLAFIDDGSDSDVDDMDEEHGHDVWF